MSHLYFRRHVLLGSSNLGHALRFSFKTWVMLMSALFFLMFSVLAVCTSLVLFGIIEADDLNASVQVFIVGVGLILGVFLVWCK